MPLCFRLTQGLKSPSLQKICPLIVKFQYLSAFLQLQSLFNHIGYLSSFLERLTTIYPAEEAWYTAIIIGELVRSPAIRLPYHVYVADPRPIEMRS